MFSSIKGKEETIVQLVAIVLVVVMLMSYVKAFYGSVKANIDLKKLRAQESTFINDLDTLQQEKQNYSQLLVQVATQFYVDARLYNLYKSFENEVGGSFESLTLDPTYTVDNGVKWFTMEIQVSNINPIQFFTIIKKQIPPLYVVSFTATHQGISATVKGMISSPYDQFKITKDLYEAGKYTVCRFVAMTPDKTLADKLKAQGLYVTIKEQNYYAGYVVANHLDALTAESLANQYSSQGIIMFIAKED
jgi:type II secretory pathway pseudopilin PulG